MMQPADQAWIALVCGAIIFEFASDDLLSESSLRFVAAHPVLGRLIILGVAGHLSGVLPFRADVFDARNLVHVLIIKGYRRFKI
jgi:hypothetical protein